MGLGFAAPAQEKDAPLFALDLLHTPFLLPLLPQSLLINFPVQDTIITLIYCIITEEPSFVQEILLTNSLGIVSLHQTFNNSPIRAITRKYEEGRGGCCYSSTLRKSL